MNVEQSVAIMKALADPSRLAIINSLLERSQYVEELATRHALAPSTVSFHLRKLESANLVSRHKEQYYVVFSANTAIFDTTLRELVSASPVSKELQNQRMDDYERKVLNTFFYQGRLEKLPAQHKKRIIVLRQFASRFELNRRYREQDVTELILPLFDDYCLIRRLMIEEGMICRNGSNYWREKHIINNGDIPREPPSSERDSGKMLKTERNAIKKAYKQESPEMGVYQIRNMVNGKLYVGSSRNLDGERNSRLFQLRMGKTRFSRDLQKDLTEHGHEAFEFSVLATLEKPKPDENAEQLLLALELRWLDKLQPFGEHGYNSVKSYQRDLERMRGRTRIDLS